MKKIEHHLLYKIFSLNAVRGSLQGIKGCGKARYILLNQ